MNYNVKTCIEVLHILHLSRLIFYLTIFGLTFPTYIHIYIGLNQTYSAVKLKQFIMNRISTVGKFMETQLANHP